MCESMSLNYSNSLHDIIFIAINSKGCRHYIPVVVYILYAHAYVSCDQVLQKRVGLLEAALREKERELELIQEVAPGSSREAQVLRKRVRQTDEELTASREKSRQLEEVSRGEGGEGGRGEKCLFVLTQHCISLFFPPLPPLLPLSLPSLSLSLSLLFPHLRQYGTWRRSLLPSEEDQPNATWYVILTACQRTPTEELVDPKSSHGIL